MTIRKFSCRELFIMAVLTFLLYVLFHYLIFDTHKIFKEEIHGVLFKCTACNHIAGYSIRDLQKMQESGKTSREKGPMRLECPKCNNLTLTQAVKCPNCGEIFVLKIVDFTKNAFDDKCPKCKKSYAQAWKEKYRRK